MDWSGQRPRQRMAMKNIQADTVSLQQLAGISFRYKREEVAFAQFNVMMMLCSGLVAGGLHSDPILFIYV